MKNATLTVALLLFLTACSTQKMKWVAIGDSITYLNDHTDETGDRVTKGYMTLVAEELPHLEYVNKGFNGWTATDVAGKINDLGLAKADLYTIFLGTNDWWRGTATGTLDDYIKGSGNTTFFGSFRIIIDKLRTLNPDARIILITPMQRVDFVYVADMKNNAFGSYKKKNGQSLSQFATAVLKIGEYERLEVIDLYNESGLTHENLVKFKRLKDPATGVYKDLPYPEFIDIPFDPETDEYPYPPEAADMTYDGLHPSDKGYAVIARLLGAKIMADR
ncbi:MAG TPA: SGNH/GDSL hydrolase family protein [Chryseosolibacter sp.]|nr:SGNH/GDSL hydrolase family protein [Chryseosolibacter sp.]